MPRWGLCTRVTGRWPGNRSVEGCGVKHAGVRPRAMGAIGGFRAERASVRTPGSSCHCTELKARRLVSGLDLVTHWPCDLQGLLEVEAVPHPAQCAGGSWGPEEAARGQNGGAQCTGVWCRVCCTPAGRQLPPAAAPSTVHQLCLASAAVTSHLSHCVPDCPGVHFPLAVDAKAVG